MAYETLHRLGYRNMKVLWEGIPGWYEMGYPIEGRRASSFEHPPYSRAAWALGSPLPSR